MSVTTAITSPSSSVVAPTSVPDSGICIGSCITIVAGQTGCAASDFPCVCESRNDVNLCLSQHCSKADIPYYSNMINQSCAAAAVQANTFPTSTSDLLAGFPSISTSDSSSSSSKRWLTFIAIIPAVLVGGLIISLVLLKLMRRAKQRKSKIGIRMNPAFDPGVSSKTAWINRC